MNLLVHENQPFDEAMVLTDESSVSDHSDTELDNESNMKLKQILLRSAATPPRILVPSLTVLFGADTTLLVHHPPCPHHLF